GFERHRPVQQQFAQRLGELGAARFAGGDDVVTLPAQPIDRSRDVRALAGAVDTLEGDEATFHRPPRWYFHTARLWLARSDENSLVPSPRETKYNAPMSAGCRVASIDALPGNAIGVGGRPARVYVLNSVCVCRSGFRRLPSKRSPTP